MNAKLWTRRILVLAFWLGVWALSASLVDRELLLPGPWEVAKRLASLVVTGGFWRITMVSLGRILLGAALGTALGVLLAMGTSRFAFLRAVLSPVLSVIKAVPVASFILLVLIWVGRDTLPCVIVVLMVAPVVWSSVTAGIYTTDAELLELARVYRFSPWRTLTRIYAPSVGPYFLSACHTCLGLAWKSGVAAEVLTVPAQSIGRELFEAKLYLESVDLFAWTLVVVLCSLILEKLLSTAITRLGRRPAWGGRQL